MAVVHSEARTQNRSPVTGHIPCETDTRLKHLFVARQGPVGSEPRIVQENAISGVVRSNRYIRKYLSFPTEAVIQCKVLSDLPSILRKQGVIFVFDI